MCRWTCVGDGMEKGFLVVFILCIRGSISSFHEDRLKFITRVTHICPDVDKGVAEITALSDVIDSVPYALCRDEKVYRLNFVNLATWKINASFTGDPASMCVFYKKDNSLTYVINVYIPLTGGVVMGREMPHVVTCTFEANLLKESEPANFADSKRPLKGMISNVGDTSKSTIDLFLADVKGRPITGRISLGRLVKLHATLIGDVPGEESFQALQCHANGRNSAYNILIGGCGDGVVLEKDVGFTTNGKTCESPIFKTFKLIGTTRLTFTCTFVICSDNCDGTSCNFNATNTKYLTSRVVV